MKLKQLKTWVNKLSKKELEKELLFNSEEYSVSGVVEKIKKARGNLYYTGEDDPASLYTKKQLIENGYDKEEIESFDVEIKKGEYYIEIGNR